MSDDKRLELIDRGIFLADSGYWWAWSNVKPDRIYSLHTKDRDKAQAKYDKQLAELQLYLTTLHGYQEKMHEEVPGTHARPADPGAAGGS